MTSSITASSRRRSFNEAMAASPGTLDLTVEPSRIVGRVPDPLRGGAYLSNGPGWTRIGGRLAHPFDGHGYVRRFEFLADGSCRLRARFVETRTYLDESKAGRLVHRGLATNIGPRFWQNIGFGAQRNVANTTIVPWGDRLLAGWEGGAPHALDPESLATHGEHTFDGALAGQATLAHMRHDHAGARLVTCSVKAARSTQFVFREFDRDDRLVASHRASVDGMLFTHDFALTSHWFVLGGNPLRLDPWELARMALGASTLLRAVATDTRKPGVLHLVPRDGSARVRTVQLPAPAFVVHFGNAFERDGNVIVDACVFHHFEFGEEFGYTGPTSSFDPSLPDARGPQRLYRITVKKDATEATWEPLSAHGVDFPRFHPDHEGRETPVLFGATRKDIRFSDPFDSILRVDLHDRDRPAQLFTAPENVFVGEPVFVPSPDQVDRGHVLAVLSDGLRAASTLAVFDAASLDAGPLAQIPLPLLPIAFHGDWLPARAG